MRAVTAEHLIKVTPSAKLLNLSENNFSFVETDSRKVKPGHLFWVLKGENHDAHEFIAQAIELGARGVVLDNTKWGQTIPLNVTIIAVTDTLKALQDWASYEVRQMKAQVLAITGSSGKTTTKEFARQILEAQFKVHSNKGSFNNHFGVPFNILSAPTDTQVLIVEMGMNHKGEIKELIKIADPDLVACTMVGQAHLEFFGSLDKIAESKFEIYNSSSQVIGIFNLSNRWTLWMLEEYKKLYPDKPFYTFKTCDEQTIKEISIQNETISNREGRYKIQSDEGLSQKKIKNTALETPDVFLMAKMTSGGLLIKGWIESEYFEIKTGLWGEHHVTNIMAAVSFGLALKMSPQLIGEQIAKLHTPWGRTQLVKLQSGAIALFDAYNANPESMEAVIHLASQSEIKTQCYYILGEMLELGANSSQAHEDLGYLVGNQKPKGVVFFGPHSADFLKGYEKALGNTENLSISDTYNEMLAISIKNMLKDNDLVVIKGSRGMKLERAVQALEPILFEVNK